jgi:hypothetical protein
MPGGASVNMKQSSRRSQGEPAALSQIGRTGTSIACVTPTIRSPCSATNHSSRSEA